MGIGKIYVPKNNICVKIICLLQYDVNDSIFFFHNWGKEFDLYNFSGFDYLDLLIYCAHVIDVLS